MNENNAELEAIENALEAFEKLQPRPMLIEPELIKREYIQPVFWEKFGLEAVAMILSVIGSMVISAYTVGLMLFISALNTDARLIIDQIDSPVITWFLKSSPFVFWGGGMLAFEFYAIAHGLAVGKRRGTVVFSNWALGASFFVMISCGFMRSLGLNQSIKPFWIIVSDLVDGGVVFSTALGAPFVVYFGIMNIGVFLHQYDELKKDAKNEYDDLIEADRQEHLRKCEEKQILYRQEKEFYDKSFMRWYRNNAAIYGGSVPEPVSRKKKEEVEIVDTGITEMVRTWLREHELDSGAIGTHLGARITPAKLAAELGLPNSNSIRPIVNRLKNKGE